MRGIYPKSKRVAGVAALAVLVTFMTACPSQKDLTAMAKASRELAHDTVVAEKTVGEFYLSGRLSKPKKDNYADKLKKIAVDGKKFNDILITLDKQYPEGTLPPDKAEFVRNTWQPLSLLISSVLGDLLSDGLKDAGKGLDKHSTTITEVLSK